jgi:hypothetical protein
MSQMAQERRFELASATSPLPCRLNRSTQHLILDEKMECIQSQGADCRSPRKPL